MIKRVLRALTALALLTGSTACTWNLYDRVIAVAQCPTFLFVLKADNQLHGLRVLYRSNMGREDVYWHITPRRSGQYLRTVCYGVAPPGYRQVTPDAGPPEHLLPGRYLVETEGSGGIGWISYGFEIDDDGRAGPLEAEE